MDLEAIRNDNNDYDATVVRKGQALNLDSAKLWLTIRDAEDTVFFKANTTDDPTVIFITDAAKGKFSISLAPSVTTALTRQTTFLYDVQAQFSNGKIRTIQRGKFTVTMDVTHA